MKIDVHAHYVPDGYRAALVQAGHDQPDGMPWIPEWSARDCARALSQARIRKTCRRPKASPISSWNSPHPNVPATARRSSRRLCDNN